MFYGGWSGTALSNPATTLTRLDSSGALKSNETNIGATARGYIAGASLGSTALYAGGFVDDRSIYRKTVTRVDESGTLLGESLAPNVSGLQAGAAAGIAGVGLFYAQQELVRMDSSGVRLSYQQPTLTSHYLLGAAALDNSVALFYAGYPGDSEATSDTNAVNRFDSNGSQIGSETFVGTQRFAFAMAGASTCAIAYGSSSPNAYNLVTRLNSSGSLVGSETAIGVGNTSGAAAGAQANDGVIFYGGALYNNIINNVLKVNSLGTQVGTDSSLGTARMGLSGAGF
jgi:hypothetical protein